jgi:DNA ligase 1
VHNNIHESLRKSSPKEPERKSLKLETEPKSKKKVKESPKTPKAASASKKKSESTAVSKKKAASPAVKTESPENKPLNGQSKEESESTTTTKEEKEVKKDDGKVLKIQSAGAGQAGADYNPSKKNYNPINDAFWNHGEK